MAQFGLLNWIIVATYLAVNLWLGYRLSRRVTSAQDYYVGDRSAPWWAIGISVVATYVSALSFLGGPAWAYGDGMSALIIHVNYSLVVFVCIVFFIPFFYNAGVPSIYEYLERRFGRATRLTMSTIFLFTMSIGAASILTATAIVVTFATGIPTTWAIILMTAIIVIYTMMGGMNAVIWTDVLQGAILVVGALIILIALLTQVGPMGEALTFLDGNGKLNPVNPDLTMGIPPTLWAGVFAMTLYHVTVYGARQFMIQRALAAKTMGDAKKSYMMMGFAAFFLYFLFFFIGALLYVFYRGEPSDEPNALILEFARTLAVPGLLGIIGAAILSASMSSCSSAFNSISTVFVTDFYKLVFRTDETDKHYLLVSRIVTVVAGVVVVPIALAFAKTTGESSILETLSRVGAYFVGSQLALFGMGFFSKHTNQAGMLTGVIAGFVGLLMVIPIGPLVGPVTALWGGELPMIAWPWYPVIAGGINIAVAWVVSVLWRPRKRRFLELGILAASALLIWRVVHALVEDGVVLASVMVLFIGLPAISALMHKLLGDRATDWPDYSVPGQMAVFEREGRLTKANGWYIVPGRVEPVVWLLPVWFVLTLVFLVWFGTLG